MFGRFPRGVAVGFEGKCDVPHIAAIPLDGLIKTFALDGKGARIIVTLAMDQQERLIDLLGVSKG